jgi:hypothetical protein
MTPLQITRVAPRRVFVAAPLRVCPLSGPCDIISEGRVGGILTVYAVKCVATGLMHHCPPQYVFDVPQPSAEVVYLADWRMRRAVEGRL